MDINTKWQIKKKSLDQQWLQGYQIPCEYLDVSKIKKEKENYLIAVNKTKAPKPKPIDQKANRHSYIDQISKQQTNLPGPWQYQTQQNWAKSNKAISQQESKEQQAQKYKWQGIPKEKQQFVKSFEKQKPVKIDKNAQKLTFIDKIYKDNGKKDYPIPGPQQYYMDITAAKRFYSDKAQDFAVKQISTQKKTILSKQDRNLVMKQIVKHSQSVPAPGYCQPDYMKIQNKPKASLGYQQFKEKELKDNERHKIQEKQQQEQIDQLLQKTKINIKSPVEPLHVDFNTFDLIKKQHSKHEKIKYLKGFGTQERFIEGQDKKWEKSIQIYNQILNKKLDPKKDPQPGPQSYSLINYYQGKISKKDKDKKTNKEVNYFKRLSQGTQINPYFQKQDQKQKS